MRVFECFGERFKEFSAFFERLGRPDFDLHVSESFQEIFILHVEIFWNLSLCHGTQFDEESVGHAYKTVSKCQKHVEILSRGIAPKIRQLSQQYGIELGICPVIRGL